MNALNVVFYLSLAAAVVLTVAAMFIPQWRRRLLFAAAGLYTLIGVVGILSVGVLFLAIAVVCVVVASRSEGASTPKARPASDP